MKLIKHLRKRSHAPKWLRVGFLGLNACMVMTLYVLASRGFADPQVCDVSSSLSEKYMAEKLSEALLKQDEPRVQYFTPFGLKPFSGKVSCTDAHPETCSQLSKLLALEKEKKSHAQQEGKVARLYLSSFPKDFGKQTLSAKKKLFLKSLLPLILQVNEEIAQERRHLMSLIELQKAGYALHSHHKAWLQESMKKYRVKPYSLETLMSRMDVVPVSLALSQAVVETGWGTSFAARKKNSPFGMSVDDKVLNYKSLLESVRAYVLTLNRHQAYRSFRLLRHELRKEKKALCSIHLAEGLQKYSCRGQAYIRQIQRLIETNNLQRFDQARLA